MVLDEVSVLFYVRVVSACGELYTPQNFLEWRKELMGTVQLLYLYHLVGKTGFAVSVIGSAAVLGPAQAQALSVVTADS